MTSRRRRLPHPLLSTGLNDPGGTTTVGGTTPPLEPLHTINLVVCDSQPIFAQGLVRLLATEGPEFVVLEVTSRVEDLQEMAERLQPQLVMLDARFGIGPARNLTRFSPPVKVILMAAADQEVDLGEALGAGVCAYLLKDHGIADIVNVLRLVMRDLMIVPAALARKTLQVDRRGPELDGLERRILAHMACGATNAQIAAQLGISDRTVRRRVLRICAKLHVGDRAEAARYGQRQGLRPESNKDVVIALVDPPP